MPRFYLHLQSGDKITQDEEGDDLPGAEKAREKALASVREILASAIRYGLEPAIDGIVVADEEGRHLLSVSIRDALPRSLRP